MSPSHSIRINSVDIGWDVARGELAIYPSERVLDRELARLRLGHSAERERELMQRIDAATAELRAKIAVIEEGPHLRPHRPPA